MRLRFPNIFKNEDGYAAIPMVLSAVVSAVGAAVVAHQNRPDAPVLPGQSSAAGTQAAAQAAAANLAKRRGAASTILTGSQGILGSGSVQKTTLGA